jgi:6-phosphogluconolactonase (cycloisomerase 2 family)
MSGLLCALLVACGGGGGGGASPEVRAFALGVSSGYQPVTDSGGTFYDNGSGDGSGGDGGAGGGGGGESGGAGAGAGLGAFVNAVVTVERADGTRVGSAVTDAYGMVSIRNGGNKQPLLITVQGAANATYWDEALQQAVPFPASQTMHAMVAAKGTGQTLSQNVGITPLTEAAYRYAVNNLGGANAWRTAANIVTANDAVKNEFNRFIPSTLQIDDITRLPALARDATSQVFVSTAANAKNVNYGLVAAGLVRAATAQPPVAAPGIELLKQLSLDLADGKLDSTATTATGSVPIAKTAYDPASLAADVVVGVAQMTDVNGKAQPITPFSLGGTVTGLTGSGLVLAAGTAEQAVAAGATSFTLGTVLVAGSSYDVRVKTQPAGQTCTVTAGTGTASGNVGNVAVSCVTPPPPSYRLGGTVAGLTGSGLVLTSGTFEQGVPPGATTFSFGTVLSAGSSYDVQVKTQPLGQTCAVSAGSGTATGNVGNVAVNCVTPPPIEYSISATVTGLTGSGLVLQTNGANNVAVGANGAVTLVPRAVSGSLYIVTVLTQPTGPAQTCTVGNASGTVSANVTNVTVTCATPPPPTLGGAVSGLLGSGLVLEYNNGSDLAVSANGSFTFVTPVIGGTYSVGVRTQPTSPSQTCTVGNGSGTATTNVTNVTITCVTNTFTVGGAVTGLVGSLVLQNNGANNLTVTSNGSVTFSAPILSGGTYGVTVLTQPVNQNCQVTNGAGPVTTANITTVAVTCTTNPPQTVSIGGTVSGLAGTNLVLLNGATSYTVTANGQFTFSPPVVVGSSYNVTVGTQPSNVTQVCTVSNGTGTAIAPVTNVVVNCVTSSFNVGGTVSGLAGSGLVLVNNGTGNVAVSASGNVSFGAAASGSSYNIAVLKQPTAPFQACTVTNGSGTVGGASVVNINVSCANQSPRYAYVTNASDNSVSSYAVDAVTGRLQFIDKAPTGAGPRVVTVDPTQRFAYVVNNGDTTVSQYTIAANGSLTPMAPASVPAAGYALSVTIDPSGRFAYVTNCGNSTLSQYSVGATGGLTPIAGSPSVDNPGCPIAVAVHPSGRFAYAANANSNDVSQYAVGPNGALTPLATPTVGAGTSPFHVTVDPTGRFAYTANANSSDLSQYTIGADGRLTPVAGAPTVATGQTPNAVSIDPSGRFAYASIYGIGVAAQFSIGAGGALTPIAGTPTVAAGFAPAFVSTDPSGKFAYVVNAGSSDISQYTIGPDGALAPNPLVSVSAPGSSPAWMAFSSGANAAAVTARFGYAVNVGPNTGVASFTTDANGALAANGGVVAAGSGPEHIAVHPTRKFAYVANYGGGVFQYTVGADGVLAPMATPSVVAGLNPYGIAVHPSGRFAYATNQGGNNVSMFNVAANGSLVAMSQLTVASGNAPTSITIDPSGRFAYVVGDGSNFVAQYTIGVDGVLNPMSPATVPAGASPSEVAVDPTGRFAYVASFDNTSGVLQFAIGPTGALTPLPTPLFQAGVVPRSVTVDPSGRFAYMADVNTGNLYQFAVGANGALSAIAPPILVEGVSGLGPQKVVVDPSGRFVYVTLAYGDRVAMYGINANGSLSPLSPPAVSTGATSFPRGFASIGSWQ